MDPAYVSYKPQNSAIRLLLANLAALVGVVLVAIGFWLAGDAAAMAQRADRPELALWALRTVAIAMIAAAQVIFTAVVVPTYFPRHGIERPLTFAFSVIACASFVVAGVVALRSW